MAIMYPKNIELYESTYSERKVFKYLEDQLPETYSVFYSVSWVDSENGQRKESECDFLIFSENEGFLTCEVKGGDGLGINSDRKFVLLDSTNGDRVLHRSPMAQSEESSRYFVKLFEETYNTRYNGVYGSISFFPFYQVNDPSLMDHRPKEVVFDIDDVNNLLKCIRKAFSFYKTTSSFGSLTKEQKKLFKEMINKKIASKASAGSIIEAKEFELRNINRVQNNLVYFLQNYNRTFITGGAGTGKTWLAIKFAKRALMSGKKVLIVNYDENVLPLFEKELDGFKNICCTSYNNLLRKDGLNPELSSLELFGKYDDINYEKFDSIIVDEAQDFDEYEAAIISCHLSDCNSEFRVFYDKTQNIFDKDFKGGFDIKSPEFPLKENLRNTASIYDWATENTGLGKEEVTNRIIGPEPVSYSFYQEFDLFKNLQSEILKLVDIEKVPISNIVVLVDHPMFDLTNEREIGRWKCVNIITDNGKEIPLYLVEDYKGLESDVIFYLHKLDTPENYNYVAYTRAKYYLFELIMKG